MKIDPATWASDMKPPTEEEMLNLLRGAPPVLSRNEIQQEARGLEWKLRVLLKEHGVQAFMRSLGNALSDR